MEQDFCRGSLQAFNLAAQDESPRLGKFQVMDLSSDDAVV